MKDDIKVIQITGWRRNPKKINIEKVREALMGLLEMDKKAKKKKK